MDELKNHKIKHTTGTDILRWGHEPKGTFTTKESYHLLVHNGDNPQDPNWNKIWSLKTWSKIHTFLWLLRHKRTLMWNNIMKERFVRAILMCDVLQIGGNYRSSFLSLSFGQLALGQSINFVSQIIENSWKYSQHSGQMD